MPAVRRSGKRGERHYFAVVKRTYGAYAENTHPCAWPTMIAMVNVRDAVMADASAIHGLLRLLGHGQSRESIETEIALRGSATARVVVATNAETVVGFAAFAIWRAFAEQMSVCRLSAIAVRRESRGLGVGGLLIREAERQAQAAGCAVVELSCGRRPERAAAHAFYVSLGFDDACRHHAMFRKPLGSDGGLVDNRP